MNARTTILRLTTAAILTALAAFSVRAADGNAPVPTPVKTAHVPAHGLLYYVAEYGEGKPLLLLHGGLGEIEMFGPNLTALAEHRRVIGVDLQGHGRTPLGERPIDAADMGDDLAAILDSLGYAQVDVLGYSLGGSVAFRLAVQHPAKVRRLVLVSTPFAQDGFYPEMLPQQAQLSAAMVAAMKDTPMYRSYAAIAPDVSEFPKLLDAMGAYMRSPYDWSEDARALAMPVMLVYGDSDMVTLDHVTEFYHLLGGAQRDAGWMREHMAQNRLAILPGVTHYEIGVAPALVPTVLPFLNGASGAKSRAGHLGDGR